MKQLLTCLIFCTLSIMVFSQANPTSQNKPGTTILNSSSNNSVSGVNPNGNPGTILYNNSNSSAVNNTLISPNTPVTTTIISTPNNTPVVTRETPVIPPGNGSTVITSTTTVNPNVSATTAVQTRIDNPAYPSSGVADNDNPISKSNPTVVQVTGNTLTGLKPGYSTSPVLVNYVPEIIITKLRNTYADKLYDITMLKKSGNQLYIVRVKEAGGYITYYLDAEGNVIK
ncbi:MAG: hypothetical protein ABIO04_10840 [Ferruginibacter sp.]